MYKDASLLNVNKGDYIERYSFSGWQIGSNKYEDGGSYTITEDVTATALFENIVRYYKVTITNAKTGLAITKDYQIKEINGTFIHDSTDKTSLDTSNGPSFTIYVLEGTTVTVSIRALLKTLYTEGSFTVYAKNSSGTVLGSATSDSTSAGKTFTFTMPSGVCTISN